MELFHVISVIFFTHSDWSHWYPAFPANLFKFGVRFNLLIRRCCDSGYPWRMVIDWLVWCSCENPNSPVFTGDVTKLKPGAEAMKGIREARCNSMHTLGLASSAQYVPLVFLNSITLNSPRSCVLNWDSSHFNEPIVPVPFIAEFGPSSYENNGLLSVQKFEMEQQDPEANSNLHLHVHVLLWSFDDFPQLIVVSLQETEKKPKQNIS